MDRNAGPEITVLAMGACLLSGSQKADRGQHAHLLLDIKHYREAKVGSF
jgi:hypothetical protein